MCARVCLSLSLLSPFLFVGLSYGLFTRVFAEAYLGFQACLFRFLLGNCEKSFREHPNLSLKAARHTKIPTTAMTTTTTSTKTTMAAKDNSNACLSFLFLLLICTFSYSFICLFLCSFIQSLSRSSESLPLSREMFT